MIPTTVIYKHGKGEHFEVITYPDKQHNVELDMGYFNNVKSPIVIKCNIRFFHELEILLALVAALRKHDFHVEKIHFIYLFGMRSDRSFGVGMPNYFRDVVAPIINGLKVDSIEILAPHSQLALSALGREIDTDIGCEPDSAVINIGADESFYLMNPFHCDMHFSKYRDNDGSIRVHLSREFKAALDDYPLYKPILILDDLCDGGATFIKIAEYLEKFYPARLRHLYVCHGLFTKGIENVSTHYDKIITTNSYREFEPTTFLEVINVWS